MKVRDKVPISMTWRLFSRTRARITTRALMIDHRVLIVGVDNLTVAPMSQTVENKADLQLRIPG